MADKKKFLIVGAGLTGCTLANLLAEKFDCEIDIVEERNHIGGNCHTARDLQTGIMVHEYGPHIFNTDDREVWDYVNKFGRFQHYTHRVKAVTYKEVYSFPINLHTLNQVFTQKFSPKDANDFLINWVGKLAASMTPTNFEEQAKSMVGGFLYELFFEGYTWKQWGCDPALLPASIMKRIPIRYNYNDAYHEAKYTGIPREGYTAIMQRMIRGATVFNNESFNSDYGVPVYDHTFYTGPIDAFFNYKFGRLGYRTVTFEHNYADGDYQGAAQLNYCDASVPYTRIVEHKHLSPWESHEKTIYTKEYSKETGPNDIPFYPKRLAADKAMLEKYQAAASSLENVSFLGRLATYRYMDMQHVVKEAIEFVKNF